MDRIERNGTVIAILAFAAVAVFGIAARPLLPVDETRYLTVAWEMRLGGHWLVPRLNGEIYSHKPPLLFWLINLVWSVTGVSETAARLVGPAFGVASIAATAGLARRLWPADPGIGGRAALVLASLALFALYAGLTMFDAMLTLATVLGLRALVAGQTRPGAWIWLGLALAFGAFAKGPVILIHLLPAALLTPVWAGEAWRPALLRLGKALALGLALVAVWLVPAIIAGGPEYREAVLWTQSAGRVANSFAHGRPIWFFVALLPVLLWPWAWSAGLWRRAARLPADPGLRLCLVWGLATLAIFSLISGKQVHYLLPALPAVALLAARAMPGRPGERPVGAPAAGLLPLVLGAAFILLALGFGPDDIQRQVSPDWTVGLVGALLIGLAAATVVLRGGAIAAAGLGLVVLINLAFLIGPPGRLYDSRPIAAEIGPHDDGGVAILGSYEGEWTFSARLRNPVLEFRDLEAATTWLAATPGGVLIARLDKAHPEGAPDLTTDYNARPLGFWRSPSVPAN